MKRPEQQKMHRNKSLFIAAGIVLLILLLPIILFVSQMQQVFQRAAGNTNLPADGQGVYEDCVLSTGQLCIDRLNQVAAGGFKLVLNYSSLNGSASDLLAYANAAQKAGVKIIWAMDEARWYDGTNLRSVFNKLAATCNCTDNTGFILYFINLVKNNLATWGYYIGDEVDPTDHAKLKVFSDLIHRLDPSHPRLFIGSATGISNTWQGISPFYDTTDVIGDDFYPIGYTSAGGMGLTAQIASGDQAYADKHGLGSAMVLQAFNHNQYSYQTCSPWISCATFPTLSQMEQQLNLAITNMHPRLILWYSFYNTINSDNPSGHWNDLVTAARSVRSIGLSIVTSHTRKTTATPTLYCLWNYPRKKYFSSWRSHFELT